MKKEIDIILKNALTPMEEPDFWLNQKILQQVKEQKQMRKQRRIPAVVLTTVIVLGLGSGSAYAAWHYMSPKQVAETVTDTKLKQAFSGKDAIMVNEIQSCGEYNITLLGIVSGDTISDYLPEYNGKISGDRTYSVTAIERVDGKPMPDTSEDAYAEQEFLVSPYIKGYNPAKYNAFTLSGGYQDFVEDGILYRLSECDNVEVFADKGVYLGISDGSFYNAQAYVFDEKTGEIVKNDMYEGVNALFELPLDRNKADAKAAAEYISSIDESKNDTVEIDNEQQELKEIVSAWMQNLSPENIDEKAHPIESTRQVLTPDVNGYFSYSYQLADGSGGSGTDEVSNIFPNGKRGMSEVFSYSYSDGGINDLEILTFTLNEDGTITFVVYMPN
ncbi:MAG: DUF4179 domain-containing protein [Lachnospiraceae bacterium]|nr:DUF4179 domain-containing protein [Lachnospiraceae bacterium]